MACAAVIVFDDAMLETGRFGQQQDADRRRVFSNGVGGYHAECQK